MEIKEAITKAENMMKEGKRQLQISVEKLGATKTEQCNPLPDNTQELCQKSREKVNKFIKDKENVEGIKYLEENGEHFTMERGRKYALYLYPNGSFKHQQWGMFMGDKYITSTKIGNFGICTLEMISSLNFKELLVKQILEIGKNKRVKPEDAFKEMFG